MVWQKQDAWKFVLVYMINWYMLQLRIHHNWEQNTPNCLNFQFNYNCDISRVIYTSFRPFIHNKPAYYWPEGMNMNT